MVLDIGIAWFLETMDDKAGLVSKEEMKEFEPELMRSKVMFERVVVD